MQQDDVIWSIVNDTFCSHKVQTKTQHFCRNEYNVTGLCSRTACPLANSNYATVRETEGKLHLYIKTIERAAFPAKLWEKIKLSENREEQEKQIDKHLMYWPNSIRHRCKNRALKLSQYLTRCRRLALRRQKKIVAVPRKIERRERKREVKALLAAKLETNIEKELLERLKKGTYNDLYSFSQKAFKTALQDEEQSESEYETEKEVEMEEEEDEREKNVQYVAADDFEESDDDDDLEELANRFDKKRAMNNDSSDSSDEDEQAKKRKAKKVRRPRVEIEYENEDTQKVRVRN